MPDISVLELATKSPEEINTAVHKSKSERIAELVEQVTQYKAEALGWHNASVRWEKLAIDRKIEIDNLQERVRILSVENVRILNRKGANLNEMRQYPA